VLSLLLAALLLAGLPIAGGLRQTAHAGGNGQVLYAQSPCTSVYAAPDTGSRLLTQLLGGTDLYALGQVAGAGGAWEHVRIWSGVEGYTLVSGLGARIPADAQEGNCSYPGLPDAASAPIPPDPGAQPLATSGTLSTAATLYPKPDEHALPIVGLPVGLSVSVQGWQGDAAGRPWYHVHTATVTGWVWSGAVQLDLPDPAARTVRGQPIWSPVAGKGMWFTNYLPHHSDVNAVVQAAKKAGITHLYTEVAITQYGFYARNTLDRLLPAAHAAGIAVISWVYPDLKDISADIRLTEEVADYVTPTGDRADGVATDVEEVDDSATVYTYGQVLRALLGPDTLLVAAVFHPFAQVYYPYAAIAASWNVIAPMDYWHSRAQHHYTDAEVGRFVGNSLMTIRAALSAGADGAMLPIEELGQTYDMYSNDFTGASDAPTAAEVTADMTTAHEFGCIGVSFFEWQTATLDEWGALAGFQW
jgi:hypothetical protein